MSETREQSAALRVTSSCSPGKAPTRSASKYLEPVSTPDATSTSCRVIVLPDPGVDQRTGGTRCRDASPVPASAK